MTLDAIIMLTGGAIAVLPFLGFPASWDDVFFSLLGVLVLVLGIAVRRNAHHALMEKKQNAQGQSGIFVESTPVPTQDIHASTSRVSS